MKKTFIMIIMMAATTFAFGQETYKSEYNDIYGKPILYVAEKEQEEFPYSYSSKAGKFELGLNFGADIIKMNGQNSRNIVGFGKTYGLNLFNPSNSGLSLNYAVNNEFHLGIAFPVYNRISMQGDYLSLIFASPIVFFDYTVILNKKYLHINPFVNVPFLEFTETKTSGKVVNSDIHFKQPFAFGLNLLLTSETTQPFIWDFLLGVYNQLKKTNDKEALSNNNINTFDNFDNFDKLLFITAGFWAGSRINDISIFKAGFVYTTTNLNADKVEMDKGSYKLDFVFNIMANKSNIVDFNFYYNIPLGAFENSTGTGFGMRYRLVF